MISVLDYFKDMEIYLRKVKSQQYFLYRSLLSCAIVVVSLVLKRCCKLHESLYSKTDIEFSSFVSINL